MASESQQPKERDNSLSALNVAIETLNLAKEVSGIAPAKAVFGAVGILLAMIRDSMSNEQEYIDLGLYCADICRSLDRGMGGEGPNDLNQSVREAVNQLTSTVAEIQKKFTKQSGRNRVSRLLHARNDKDKIAAWKSALDRVLHVFNTELVINTHVAVSGIRDDVSKMKGESQTRPAQSCTLGESPPPPPRACFGRDELIEKITDLAENFKPVALVGAGGIGKTSIALTVLHHDRIRERFGDERRFIRCDRFPPSRTNLLARLSMVIGAGIKNPEVLVPLRPFLSSKKMFIVLDNAESILDPQGVDGVEIYGVVKELCQFSNICVVITSRITTIPPDFKRLNVPTLSIDAARSTLHRIYDDEEQPDLIDKILEQLDFHPLSVTLLATVAQQNNWDNNRLAREWERRRTSMLRTKHNESLAAAIEFSLASPTFEKLGPDARELLAVVAFFPQGVDEKNLDWLFPAIPNRTIIFDEFCILSLTYRSNGFVTMLVPLRDYLQPKDPLSSPLLDATKERYFTRLSVELNPNAPGFKETGWIRSEDANVEHLLDVLTSAYPNSDGVWNACGDFMDHLFWYKPRRTVLEARIEGLSNSHPSKSYCLLVLGRLFELVGNDTGRKRVLTNALKVEKERGNVDEGWVARILRNLSDANRLLGLVKEGIDQAREALEIHSRIDDAGEQAKCSLNLALLLYEDHQLDAAEEEAFHAIEVLPEKGQEYRVCESHRILGQIYTAKGEREKAIHHFETARGIASVFDWDDLLVWIHFELATLFRDEGEFDDAHSHIELAKSHTANNKCNLGYAVLRQAWIYYRQRKFEDATSEALRAAEIFGQLCALDWRKECEDLLRDIEQATNSQPTRDTSI